MVNFTLDKTVRSNNQFIKQEKDLLQLIKKYNTI
jgi:hypothetical protein